MPPTSKPFTTCSVSVRPVMKTTGTSRAERMRLMRRQVSKPSSPGMMASSRIRSGITNFSRSMALRPSVATSTVWPLSLSASDSSARLAGTSSTISTTLLSEFVQVMADQFPQAIHIVVQTEALHQLPQFAGEGRVGGVLPFQLVELVENALHIANGAQFEQGGKLVGRRHRPDGARCRYADRRLRLRQPVDVQMP